MHKWLAHLRIPEDMPRSALVMLGAAMLVTLLYHGSQLLAGSFNRTYDALIHIFFGAHYSRSWFDPWEERWYTGFSMVSYPPLSHMLIALLSKLVGLKTAFAITQIFALEMFMLGIFRFTGLILGWRAAGYAVLATVVASSITQTVHLFGQLPTTLSLSFLLNAIPFVAAWIRTGRHGYLWKATAFTAATTAGHHVTTLFGSVFFVAPVVVMLWLEALPLPRPNEPLGTTLIPSIKRRLYRMLPRIYRGFLFAGLAVFMLVMVVLPYWLWSRADPIAQVPIPHGSRANFLQRTDFGFMFWVMPWFSSLWLMPYAIYRGKGKLWPILASLLLLTLLGTGGTTPLPKMLLRGAFDILTLDRFTFWATILILPFVGAFLHSIVTGGVAKAMDAYLGKRVRYGLIALLVIVWTLASIGISNFSHYRKFQPEPIDIEPIVRFIEKDQHWRYRYLTLGFGDQMAWLSANTRATTPDGNYHSARRLPELTTTPVERLEGAKFTGVPGIGSLTQFLTTPEKYNLKFIFSNDGFYDPLLYFSGWQRLNRLENGIVVWEREGIPPLPERLPRKVLPVWQRLIWGVLPPLAFVTALLMVLVPPVQWPYALKQFKPLLKEDSMEAEPAPPPRRRFRFNPTRLTLVLRLLTTGVLLGLFSVIAVRAALSLRPLNTPQSTVIQYWDHLDFRRYDEAFKLLAPQGGLTLDRWKLDFSVQGGMRTGYAKLDSIVPEVISQSDTVAAVKVKLVWLTTFGELREELQHEMVKTPQGWRIKAAKVLKVRSEERFFPQPDVDYYRSQRRLTVDATDTRDVLDHPRLQLLNARLVEYLHDGIPTLAIVGEIQNIDARPADLTVTGILRDKAGTEIVRNNSEDEVLHKLLPGEVTAFRVNFTATATPPDLTEVDSFEVSMLGLVTAHDLTRSLGVWTRMEGDTLKVQVVNVGTMEATVPQVLLALRDKNGVKWVSREYLMEAVPPREKREMTLPAALPEGYRIVRSKPIQTEKTKDSIKAPLYRENGPYSVYLNAFYREDGP